MSERTGIHAVVGGLVLLIIGCSGDLPEPRPVTADELMKRVDRAGARIVIVNFWATWCVPCREEFPEYLRFARDRKGDAVRVMFVSLDSKNHLPRVERFQRKHGVSAHTFVKEGATHDFVRGVHEDWSGALPATFVYGPGGDLRAFWEGRGSYERLDRNVHELLGNDL